MTGSLVPVTGPDGASKMAGGAGSVITLDGVSKWFGNVVAVNDITFDVGPGITGLLGPNGAGKTTLLRMMCGLAKPSEGRITVFGGDTRSDPSLYRRLGVMREHDSVYGSITGRQFVEFAAKMREVEDPGASADHAIDTVNLSDAQHRKIGGYSRGMRQRIRLAATIVHEPDALLLDEPLSGADPRQRVEFQRVLKRLADEGRTILVSSHILEEIEQLADNVLLIVSGKLAASGDYRAIRASLDERPYHVRIVSDNPRRLAAGLVQLDAIDSVAIDPNGALVVLSRNVGVLQRSFARVAQDLSVRVTLYEPLDDSLESVFGYLVER